MPKIKSYTDIEQSKKLAEILPLESADMYYPWDIDSKYFLNIPIIKDDSYYVQGSIDCWSLATLLDVLPKTVNNETLFIETSPALWHIGYRNIYTARADNPVDACVAMVEKLNELKML